MTDTDPRGAVVGIIPARAGSKGVPDKNLRLLAGKSLLARACASARAARSLDRIIVSTEDAHIADAARQAGAEVPFLRPPDLAADDTPMLAVIRHALGSLAELGVAVEIVVLLQPTSPFRTSDDIDEAVGLLRTHTADSVVSVVALDPAAHPEWQFRIEDGELRRYMGAPFSALPTRRQELGSTYVRNGVVYAFRAMNVARGGSLYGERVLALVMPADRSVNIDSWEDWRRAEAVLAGAHHAAS